MEYKRLGDYIREVNVRNRDEKVTNLLRKQLAAFYAKQVDEEMDQLWESGKFDQKKLDELRGSHFRTPYNK